MMMLGHCGYLEVVRRALKYALDKNKIKTFSEEFDRLISSWQLLNAFPEVEAALTRLNERFSLGVLSNGEPDYLNYLVKERCHFGFDRIISVNEVGFKINKPPPKIAVAKNT